MNTRERTKAEWREYMEACTPKLTPRMARIKRELKGPYKAGEPFNYIDRLKQPQFAVTKAGRGRAVRRSGWRR